MEFKYDGVTTYNNSIDIDNIYQTCLKATDENNMNYYLIIRTLLGECSCLEYGPLVEGDPLLPDNTKIEFSRFESDDFKLKKMIKKFLSPRNKGRTQIVDVYEIQFKEALDEGIDLLKYMRGFSKESNY